MWLFPNSTLGKKTREFSGKLHNALLPNKSQWLAVDSVIEPAIMYPFVNTFFQANEIKPITSAISRLRCSTLGVNRHFPMSLLYGPKSLGGNGITHRKHANTLKWINYFLYNVRMRSDISLKLEVSIIYAQLKVGTFHQLFSLSLSDYGHLVTSSFVAQLWYEMEPHGVTLEPANGCIWTPDPIMDSNIPLMELAITRFNKKGSAMINRCHIFLQVISVCDLLTVNKLDIHLAFFSGVRPPSRKSKILWPTIPIPPKKF